MALAERHSFIIKQGDSLFSKRAPLISLWQEIGDHFYPERAHFTRVATMGQDFASHLTTSYPLIARRDLGNAFSAMLRPQGKPWFFLSSSYRHNSDEEKQWLEYAAKVQRRAMYDRASQFVRATKEADHDFASWGQAILSVELSKNRDTLLYRCWHLRDVAWRENSDGVISQVHRNWTPTAHDLKTMFGEDKLATQVKNAITKEPLKEFKCRHVVLRSDEYDPPPGSKKWSTPYVSLYFDIENETLIEEKGIWGRYYIIPRWQTVSGSQYAYSPATVAALPDARLIQAITLTLLQAGEKAADPPKIAREGVLRSDVDLRSGGITWVDAEYDEKMGDALRNLEQDTSGITYGIHLRDDARNMITEAFFLNKISLPPSAGGDKMTAFEASQRVQEYIRQALPLFEPMEQDYNGSLCDETFTLLMRNGAFGPMDSVPQSLRGTETMFKFKGPLQAAEDADKGGIFQSAAALLAQAAQLDQDAPLLIDAKQALRDALYGIGTPAKWLRPADVVEQMAAQNAQQRQAQQFASTVNGLGATAEQIGKAGQALNAAAGSEAQRPAA